jgi:hypothetical protein
VSREIEESLKLVPLPWMLRDYPAPHMTHDDYWRLSEEERRHRSERLATLPTEWAGEPAAEPLLLYEAQQPPLYYWLMSQPLRLAGGLSLPARVVMIRHLSLALASLVIPLGFLIARRLFDRDDIAVGLVALIAALPEFLIDVCRVGNESLAVVVYSVLILLLLTRAEGGNHTRHALLLGTTLGVGLLTKTYFLTAIPAVLVVAGWRYGRTREGRRQLLPLAAVTFGLPAAMAGWWFLRNRIHLGSWSGMQEAVFMKDLGPWEMIQQALRVDWLGALDSAFFSHIWFGNWSFIQVRPWMYRFFGCIALIALLGLVVMVLRLWRSHQKERTAWLHPDHLLVLTSLYGFFILGIAYHVVITFAAKGLSATTGWYIYCLVAAEAALVIAGILTLSPSGARPWILPGMTACFAMLDLYATHFLLIPYYTGMTRHNTEGAVAAFHPGVLAETGVGTVLSRLLENKPDILSMPIMAVSWLLFVVATIGLVAISIRTRMKAEDPH